MLRLFQAAGTRWPTLAWPTQKTGSLRGKSIRRPMCGIDHLAQLQADHSLAALSGLRPPTEQLLPVLLGLFGDLFEANPAYGGQTCSRVANKGWFIALAANRDRSKIRAVRFNKQALQWYARGHIAQILGILVGHHAGKRDVEPHRQASLRR